MKQAKLKNIEDAAIKICPGRNCSDYKSNRNVYWDTYHHKYGYNAVCKHQKDCASKFELVYQDIGMRLGNSMLHPLYPISNDFCIGISLSLEEIEKSNLSYQLLHIVDDELEKKCQELNEEVRNTIKELKVLEDSILNKYSKYDYYIIFENVAGKELSYYMGGGVTCHQVNGKELHTYCMKDNYALDGLQWMRGKLEILKKIDSGEFKEDIKEEDKKKIGFFRKLLGGS